MYWTKFRKAAAAALKLEQKLKKKRKKNPKQNNPTRHNDKHMDILTIFHVPETKIIWINVK